VTTEIALTRGVPAAESFPVDALIECAERALRQHATTILQYHLPHGFLPLRQTIADQEGADVKQVVVGNGSIQLLDLLIRTAFRPGDTVLVERPTYDRTIQAFRQWGCRVLGIPMLDDGPDPGVLQHVMERERPRALYVIPDFQNPTGSTMSAGRREIIMELAGRYETLVIADVPYRPLRYWGEEVPSLSSYGGGELIQMSSFSKLISPGMRVGWMIAREPRIEAMMKLAGSACICPSMVPQGMVYEFVKQGYLDPTLARLKELYAPRLRACLDTLDRMLPDARWVKPEGGFFLGLTLPEGIGATDVRDRALAEGVRLSDGTGFYPDGDGSRFIRIPFCGLNEADLKTAVGGIAKAVHSLS
jgi:2-aminoadipate transaminase